MRKSATLEEWKASGRLFRERDFQRSYSRDLKVNSPIGKLLVEADSLASQGGGDKIAAIVEDFVRSDFAWLQQTFADWLRLCLANPAILPPFPQILEANDTPFSAVVLAQTPELTVSVQSVCAHELAHSHAESPGNVVQFTGQEMFYRVLRGGPIEATVWVCDPFDDASDFRALSCRREGQRTLREDDVFRVDGKAMSISFQSVERTTAILQVVNRHEDAGTAVDFDSQTGRFRAAHPMNRVATRKMILATVLRRMGAPPDAALLKNLAAEGPFYQRWHMAREVLVNGDPDPIGFLEPFVAEGMNPTVQRAAASTIKMLRSREEVA